MTVKDVDGNIVDEWTSTDKPHSIEGLVVGKTYTLSETITADEYVKAAGIKFTVKNEYAKSSILPVGNYTVKEINSSICN